MGGDAAPALLPHIKISLTIKHTWSTLSARLRQRSRKEQGYGFYSLRDGDTRCDARRLWYYAPRYSCRCRSGRCRCLGAATGLRWRAAGPADLGDPCIARANLVSYGGLWVTRRSGGAC